MKFIMFQERFVEAVRTVKKVQTIRPKRRNPLKAEEAVSLRRWTGLPYRSPQEELLKAEVTDVSDIEISKDGVMIQGCPIPKEGLDAFARADGFKDWADLSTWFNVNHGPKFSGVMISWRPS